MQVNQIAAEVQADLAQAGYRLTKLRRALLEILISETAPVSAAELVAKLRARGIDVHRASVYRELDFLLARQLVHVVGLQNGLQSYEYAARPHHHHAVCLKCERVEDVEVDHELLNLDQLVSAQTEFKVTRHSLEFFGLCAACK